MPIVLVLGLVAAATPVLGAEAKPPLVGRALHERLQQSVGLTLSEKPLREGLYEFGRSQRIGVLLDRRIDPGRPINLSLNDFPARDVLAQIGVAGGARGIWIGPLAYFGPKRAVARANPLIDRVHQAIRRLPPQAARRMVARRATQWPALTTPRQLLERLADEGRVEVDGLERLPHDLLAEASLPSMPLCDRLTVLLMQFDLTFEPSNDGRRITLRPIPDDLPIAVGEADGPSPQRRPSPAAAGTASGETRNATAPELIRIDRLVVEQVPIGPLLERIAEQLNLQLQVDQEAIEQAGLSPRTFVSVRAENVTLDELLRQVTEGTGLQCRRQGRTLLLQPAP